VRSALNDGKRSGQTSERVKAGRRLLDKGSDVARGANYGTLALEPHKGGGMLDALLPVRAKSTPGRLGEGLQEALLVNCALKLAAKARERKC